MINIFEKNATSFNNNGLATLEPVECLFKPAINGVWQLEMVLPYDAEKKSDLIANDRILKVTGLDCITEQTNTYQLFRIYDFKKGDNNVSVIAFPIGLDARFDTFKESLNIYDKTPAQAVNDINTWLQSLTFSHTAYTVSLESPQYWSNDAKSGSYTRTNLINVLNGEEGFVNIWGGEICYDNYSIKMEHHMGTYDPVDVRYGKNILGMSYDMDASNVITRLYPKAKSGELLNAISDYAIGILPKPYVDADNAASYPIDHVYAVDTPYNLVQLSNDGSAEYQDSIELYNYILQETRFWFYNALLNSYDTNPPLLEDIELDWIINNYALTTEKDGVEGIVEHLWRNVIVNTTHNIVSKSVQNLIYSAMKAAFDEVLKDSTSGWYIGAATKKMWSDGLGQYFYSYNWDASGQYRVNGNGTGYAWVYASSKWNQLDTDGVTTGATDKTTWKWFKVKNKKWKRYGNKKKSRYLKRQTWKINDVWYWFKNDGEPQKGSALYNEWIVQFDYKAVRFTEGTDPATLAAVLIPICTEGEKALFMRLYNRMTEYCEALFDNDKLSYPVINIDINFADLSKTEEYKDYQDLEKIHLGDTVNVRNDKLGVPTLTERIIGLTYDVLRKCNTEIHIGLTESSVVNLLNSIGKTDNQTKFVAGEGITIENNVISVNPPETPYLEDVLVNGESVVRNHKAYIDLDEMGIDESIDVLYGEDVPDDDDDGEDKDFYLLEAGDVIYADDYTANSTTQHPITLDSFEKIDENKFNFVIKGKPWDDGTGEELKFPYHNMIDGETYTISFDLQESGQLRWYAEPAYDYVRVKEGTDSVKIELQKNTNLNHYETEFVYKEGDSLDFLFYAIQDNTNFTATITNLTIQGEFVGDKIIDIYNKRIGRWIKYTPSEMVGATSSEDGASGSVPKPTSADYLKYLRGDGTWQDAQGASAVSDLTDVSLDSLANGEILKYNSSTSKWENSTESSAISSLTDVDLTNLADGEILKYNATASKWENAVESGGSEAGLIIDAQIYSTDEKQVGVWIDGKPLYAKSVTTGGNAPSNTTLIQRIVQTGYDTLLYTKLSDSAGSGGFQAYGFSPVIYSEEEREIGVYVDNKPLYQKSWFLTTPLTITGKQWIDTGLVVSNGVIIDSEVVVYESDGNVLSAYSNISTNGHIWLYCLRDSVTYQVNVITVRYTKTTDVAGSGSYNTLNIPTVHYSTDEQVIGTWTDGSTLYQKTVTTGENPPSGATLRERVVQVGCDTIKYTK